MLERPNKSSMGNWIFIGMILGIMVGLFFNFFVDNPLIKDTILMDNIFYLGGNIFVRLLRMLVVPLVFCSIVVAVISISNFRKIAVIGERTILLYLFTTVISILVAMGVSIIMGQGLAVNLVPPVSQTSNITFNQSMPDMILQSIPENPLNTLTTGSMLSVILLAIIVGFILIKLNDKIQIVDGFFEELNKIMFEMTGVIMKFAPVGVFCLMAYTFGTMGFKSILPFTQYISCVLIGMAIQMFVVYPVILLVFTRLSPLKFYRSYLSVMFFAFSTLSSNATIPTNMAKLMDIGVPEEISSFTIPFGSIIHKDGTAIMQTVAIFFIAHAYGIDLGISIVMLIVLIIISSAEATPVPFSGLIALSGVFATVGLPLESIALLMPADYIVDMFETTVNITGDAITTLVVAFGQDSLDIDVFNGKKEAEKWEDR